MSINIKNEVCIDQSYIDLFLAITTKASSELTKNKSTIYVFTNHEILSLLNWQTKDISIYEMLKNLSNRLFEPTNSDFFLPITLLNFLEYDDRTQAFRLIFDDNFLVFLQSRNSFDDFLTNFTPS